MLANSTSYSQSHPHSQHPHNLQSVPVAYLDNMSGWSREYANAAPREAILSSSSSRPSFNHHQSSSSSIHEMGSSNGHPSGMTMSQNSPVLPFTTWTDSQTHHQSQSHHQNQHQHQHQHSLTSSTSSPSLLFDQGSIQGHVDQSNNHGFGYNGTGSITTSSANYRAGYSGKAYGSHPTPLTSSASYPNLPTLGSQHAAAAMYHQQHTAGVPSYLHQHSSYSAVTSNTGAVPVGAGSSLPEAKGLPASLLSSPIQPTHNHHHHHHHQRQQDNAYTSSASSSNGNNQSSLPTSPGLNDFNSEYRSSHMLHPFEVKHRRRTTRTQFKVLEATFRENPKPNASVRKSVSQQLDMPIRAVQIWFQNRRAKGKAAAKKEGANRLGDADQNNEDLDHYQSQYIRDEDKQRYSASPTSSLRRTTDSTGMSYHSAPVSASSETFKIPSRPLRIDTEASNRRMTTGAMSSSATFTGNNFYHSPPLSSSGSLGQYSSHLSNSSPSFDTRPSVSSISSSASYDDRYRRGAVTSPGVLLHDSSSVTAMEYSPQRQPLHQQYQHQPPHQYNHHHHNQHQQQQQHHPSSQIDMHLPSAFDPETRRLSLPENIPADMQMSSNLSILQQQQHHLHPPHQQQHQQTQLHHHHRSADDGSNNPSTDYWRY